MNVTLKLSAASASVMLALAISACADGVALEDYDAGVRNQQLRSPELNAQCFSTQNGTDATYTVMTWPVVYGAGGYRVSVDIVDDPQHPVAVVADSLVDGCSLTFVQQEDTKYQIRIQSAANEALGNTASEVLVYDDYTTLVAATTVPAGENLASFIRSHLSTGSTDVQAFELAAGATYEVADTIAFGKQQVQLRGDKNSHATIVFKGAACITTQAALTVKFINFDCEQTIAAPISLDPSPDSTFYYTEEPWASRYGGSQKVFYLDGDIMLKDCTFREVKGSLFSGSNANWALTRLIINNCIAEADYSTIDAFISMYGASTGTIQHLQLVNSTFYNLQENTTGYFLRLSNASNAQPQKIYGAAGQGSVSIQHCTFVKMMSGSNWWNNYVSKSNVTFTVKDNVFYDTWRIQKAIGNCAVNFTIDDNVTWSDLEDYPVDTTDKTKYATEDDPGMSCPTASVLDFNASPCYGLDAYFRPTKGIASSRGMGDTRY